MGYFYILSCIFFTVYGQLVLKRRLVFNDALFEKFIWKLLFHSKAFLAKFVLLGFPSTFLASLFGMIVITKFEVFFAYPFVSLAFVAILCLNALFFHELITLGKVLDMSLSVDRIVVSVKL